MQLLDSASDEYLVAKAIAGGLEELDLLVRRHQSWVFNLALKMCWRREVAEDATQEILIKAVTRLNTFTGSSAFRTWLYRVCTDTVRVLSAPSLHWTTWAAGAGPTNWCRVRDFHPRPLRSERNASGSWANAAKWYSRQDSHLQPRRSKRRALIL